MIEIEVFSEVEWGKVFFSRCKRLIDTWLKTTITKTLIKSAVLIATKLALLGVNSENDALLFFHYKIKLFWADQKHEVLKKFVIATKRENSHFEK